VCAKERKKKKKKREMKTVHQEWLSQLNQTFEAEDHWIGGKRGKVLFYMKGGRERNVTGIERGEREGETGGRQERIVWVPLTVLIGELEVRGANGVGVQEEIPAGVGDLTKSGERDSRIQYFMRKAGGHTFWGGGWNPLAFSGSTLAIFGVGVLRERGEGGRKRVSRMRRMADRRSRDRSFFGGEDFLVDENDIDRREILILASDTLWILHPAFFPF